MSISARLLHSQVTAAGLLASAGCLPRRQRCPGLFDTIRSNAARSGEHRRAAVQMSRPAGQAQASEMSRTAAHLRPASRRCSPASPAQRRIISRRALADASPQPTTSRSRWPGMFALGRSADAEVLLREQVHSAGTPAHVQPWWLRCSPTRAT